MIVQPIALSVLVLSMTRVTSYVVPDGKTNSRRGVAQDKMTTTGQIPKTLRLPTNAKDSQQPAEQDILGTDGSSRRAFLASVAATTVMVALPNESEAKEGEMDSKYKRNFVELPSESVSSSSVASPSLDWDAIFQKASKKALGGGKAGASAAVVQVVSLMWLRTSMNYQYRYGGSLGSSLQTLWNEGGIPRLYQGLPFALIQGPLTRFGDTAANVGILALLESTPETQALPLPIKTGLGSLAAGLWRIFLMPVDASKTAMQVEGKEGLQELWGLVQKEGPAPLYQVSLL